MGSCLSADGWWVVVGGGCEVRVENDGRTKMTGAQKSFCGVVHKSSFSMTEPIVATYLLTKRYRP